jgi:phosphoglycolate phosphatase-like HAD superfamily hydrolase
MHKLILWDVDGTLLYTGGVAASIMRGAMAQVLGAGKVPTDRTFYAGKTDWQIMRESFPDLPAAAIVEQLHTFSETYVAAMRPRRHELVEKGHLLPGVQAALAALVGRVHQAPLTGNIAPIARIKLDVFGLLPYLEPEAGAYGDDHYDRSRLVPIAAERAERHFGRPFHGPEIVIVGDTPNDIACGKANGTRTVAVATGPFSLAELQAHQPDAALNDLSDLDATLAAIFG